MRTRNGIIYLVLTVLFSSQALSSEPIKMIWWNVAWGKYNQSGELNRSLLKIKKRFNPDVLILGEYKSGIIELEDAKEIAKGFKYKDFVNYEEGSDVGILVMSKYPLTLHSSTNLPWGKNESVENKVLAQNYPEESKYWNRIWSHYSIKKNNQDFHFVPVHLLMPWKAYHKQHGALRTAHEMVFGFRNPLWYQTMSLIGGLQYNIKTKQMPTDVLLLGDFNIPNTLGPFTPEIFEDINEKFEAYDVSGKSFPSDEAQKDAPQFKGQKVTVDLAFRNGQGSNDQAKTYRYKGSDHYPLYLKINVTAR